MNKEDIKNYLGFHFDESVFEEIKIIPDKRKAISMLKKLSADYIYSSSYLEGNPLTFVEVKTILDGITVGGHKVSDTQMILNLKRALDYLLETVNSNKFELSKKIFCKIQSFVAFEEAYKWGEFRDGDVSIAGTDMKVVDYKRLDEVFEAGISLIKNQENVILKAFLVFLFGSITQFFYDGNKRSSRFLANGILLDEGYPPIVFYAEDIEDYNRYLLDFYDTKDATNTIKWLQEKYKKSSARFGFEIK